MISGISHPENHVRHRTPERSHLDVHGATVLGNRNSYLCPFGAFKWPTQFLENIQGWYAISAARGDMGPHSDLDVLVVKSGHYLRGFPFAVDLVVARPNELEQYADSRALVYDPALWKGRECMPPDVTPVNQLPQEPLVDSAGCTIGNATHTAGLNRMTIKARVLRGRLLVDEPTELPEGTEIELLPLDPGDWLDEEDRAALHEALHQSDADIAAGHLTDAETVLREIKKP